MMFNHNRATSFLALMMLVACSAPPLHENADGQMQNGTVTTRDSGYAPPWAAFREPGLEKYKGENEVYRLTWMRTFNHPVAIRMEKSPEQVTLYVKMMDGRGGYDWGKLIVSKRIPLMPVAWSELQKKIAGNHFWQLSTRIDEGGFDGSTWILEGYANGVYHAINRWSPATGPVRDIGDYLIQLSGLSISESEYY
jgi:hypothetical protein